FTLVASSMGMATACATTLANPTRVAKIAGIIPLISIAWGQSLFPVSANAAYPPVYDDATDGPYHSPLVMAATLPADLPIHLWCGDIDTTAPLSLAQDFITARPQTGLTIMPGQVHGLPAIGFAAAEVIAFVRDATTN
ncbi:MAG: hypothetical protein ABJA64_02415, partial [Candidatus Saccharibacteria bacterium]